MVRVASQDHIRPQLGGIRNLSSEEGRAILLSGGFVVRLFSSKKCDLLGYYLPSRRKKCQDRSDLAAVF